MHNPPPQSQTILALPKRAEETASERDSIDNFESQHSSGRWDASLYGPVVDEFLVTRFPDWLENISWPDSKQFAACLTHDIDSLQLRSRIELLRSVRQNIRNTARLSAKGRHLLSLAGLSKAPQDLDIFTPWMKLEEELSFRSTFFVFPTKVRERHLIDNVYRWNDGTFYRGEECVFAEVIKDLAQRGWEIGLHGSYLSSTSYDMIAEQKDDLEKTLGKVVLANRQHNLHFDAAVTPPILQQAGLKVDSTLGFNRDVGFRAGTSYPFRMWDLTGERWLDLIQIPLVLHDGALLRPDNLDLDLESAIAIGKRLIDRVAATKGVITLLWHPESIARPGWFDVYATLLRYIHEKNGWGTSAEQIYDSWTTRGLDSKLQKMLSAAS